MSTELACGWPERCDWVPPTGPISTWSDTELTEGAMHDAHKKGILYMQLLRLAARAVDALVDIAEAMKPDKKCGRRTLANVEEGPD